MAAMLSLPRQWAEDSSTDNDVTVLQLRRPSTGSFAPDDDGAASAPSGVSPVSTWRWGTTPIAGRRIGGYWMHEEIGRGGMASVHVGRTTDSVSPRLVAIKKMDPTRTWPAEATAMFLEEGRLTTRIRHPNVVPALDLVIDAASGEISLIMEYVHGETLAHLLASGAEQGLPPPLRVATGIMIAVLRGLHAAHETTAENGSPLGIVHRDVSPQNIMVGSDGVPRLIDFGVAWSLARRRSPNGTGDHSGSADRPRGKLCYVSPEMIQSITVDRRSDIFSAGIVLWEALTGRRLFRGPDRRSVWPKILHDQIVPPSLFNPDVPPALDAAVLRALERDRERRFPTARAFADELARAVEVARPRTIRTWVNVVAGESLAAQTARTEQLVTEGASERPRNVKNDGRFGDVALTPKQRRQLLVSSVALAPVLVGVALWIAMRSPQASADVRTPAAVSALAGPDRSRAIATPPAGTTPPAETVRPREILPPPSPVAAMAVPVPQPINHEPDGVNASAPSTPVAPRNNPIESPLRTIEKLNRRALSAYREHSYGSARALLRSALALCSSRRLDLHRQAALSHAQLAAVLVQGFGQQEMGIEQFRIALRIDRKVPVGVLLEDGAVGIAFRRAAAAF